LSLPLLVNQLAIMKKKLLSLMLILCTASAVAQQKVIPLYPGAAPDSEKWTWNETENSDNMYKAHTIFNISRPTLTVYPADTTVKNTGTAVIVCPGGGFHSLSIMQEGYAVVAWLQKKGITAFLLKYRLVHATGGDPYKQEIDDRTRPGADEEIKVVAGMAVTDGRTAIAYVRAHAAEYGILPSKIGFIGFSAGGYIATAMAYDYTPGNRPDFVAPIYGPFPAQYQAETIPADAPPMFIAAASDDTYGLNMSSVALYEAWVKAKHSAELHIYTTGGHGFGMNIQNIPTDSWRDRFGDWMGQLGYLKPLSDHQTYTEKRAEDWANYQKYIEDRIHNDWAFLKRYDDDNSKLSPPAPGEKRVVFMGNSITENWASFDPDFFKRNGYIGRGIGGQTSSQMLLRFREDVINLHPVAVVISAGTNDIAQNTGYISLANIFGNVVSMAELAKASGIKPILTSILPATEFSWHRGLEPADKIIKVNEMIKAYAEKNHLVYVDYWSAMVNDKKGLKVELSMDGLVHPNIAGYKVMEPLVKQGIAKALKQH
jgi:acetyl esterase/lipase/lysophospholipase L1-like esterase